MFSVHTTIFSLICLTRRANISCGNSTLASAHTRLLSVGEGGGSLWGGFDGRIKDVMSYVTVLTTQCVKVTCDLKFGMMSTFTDMNTCNASSYQKCMWNQFPDRNTVNRQLTLMWIPRMGRQSWGTVLLRYIFCWKFSIERRKLKDGCWVLAWSTSTLLRVLPDKIFGRILIVFE